MPNDYFTTAPLIWLDLLNKIPSYLICHLGTMAFSKNILKFFRALCQHGENKNAICKNCGLNRRSYRESGYKNIATENLRSPEYSLEKNFSTISKQLIVESDHLKNIFYKEISKRTTWFDNNIETNAENFRLIGPILD
jgi:hypothetical protein